MLFVKKEKYSFHLKKLTFKIDFKISLNFSTGKKIFILYSHQRIFV